MSLQRTSFFSGILFFITLIIAVVTLFCCLAPLISPAHFWVFAFGGLLFHYFYFLNLVFLVIWLFKKSKKVIAPLLPFLVGFPIIASVFQAGIHWGTSKPESGEPIKVLTYNVRLFDLYNWSHINETRELIFNFLNDEEADVLCMQEFFTSDQPIYKNLDTLVSFLNAKNTHVVIYKNLFHTDHWGIATFSKFPIVGRELTYPEKPSSSLCIATDIKIKDDTVRIYNMHLQSIRLEDVDYEFVENISGKNEDKQIEGSKRILTKLKRSFIRRAPQAEAIKKLINESPYPVIVCGDLNDCPASYSYHVLSAGLNDAFKEAGSGFSDTYIGPFPAFRIDYIFHDDHFVCTEYKKHKEKLSDHYPVSCELYLKK